MAKTMGYRIDVDAGKVRKSKDLFFDDVFAVHEKRVELYRRLWNDADWDTFMIVFTGSDRVEHFCWSDYEERIEPYYENFITYFQKVAQEIGWIAEKLGIVWLPTQKHARDDPRHRWLSGVDFGPQAWEIRLSSQWD